MQRKLDHEADLRRVAPEPARAIAITIVGIMIAVVRASLGVSEGPHLDRDLMIGLAF